MISLDKNRCQTWLYKKSQCRLCMDACPVKDCIRFNDDVMRLDSAKCIGCGICTTACPAGAIVISGLDDRALLEKIKSNLPETRPSENITSPIHLTLGCYLGADAAKPLSLPCLGILKESHLICLIQAGVGHITLDVSCCDNCYIRHGKNTINKTVSFAGSLLEAIGCSACVTMIEKPASDNKYIKKNRQITGRILPGHEYSRREALSFIKLKASQKIFGKSDEPPIPQPDDIPVRRALLLEALENESARHEVNRADSSAYPFFQLSIDDGCSLCRECSLFCPTGAIDRVEEKNQLSGGTSEVRIDFNMSKCVACHECAEFCPEGVLRSDAPADISPLLSHETRTLLKKATADCPSCGKAFFPDDSAVSCAVCEKKNQQDERMFEMMPG